MREIKFRGKRVDNGEWVEGYYQCLPNKNYASITGINAKGAMEGWRVLYETVGQFTGLLDRNGVEIYEGDIIEFKNIDRQYVKGIVYYLGSCFLIESIVADEDDYNLGGAFSTAEGLIKVIGNIHEGEQLCTSATVE